MKKTFESFLGNDFSFDIDALEKELKPHYNSLIRLDNKTTIDISKILRVDKGHRFIKSVLGNSRFEFSIIVNHNATGKDIPFADVEIWYNDEDTRDKKYDLILRTLEENGRNITNIISDDNSEVQD